MGLMNPLGGAGCLSKPSAHRTLLTLTVFGAALAAAAPASAGDSAESDVVSVNNPPIIVKSDGSNYIGVVANMSQSIKGQINVKLNTGVAGRVLHWSAGPTLSVLVEPANYPSPAAYANFTKFEESGHSESYSTPRPKSVNKTFGFEITKQQYADYVVEACNMMAENLRDNGLTDQQIFAEHRTAMIDVGSTLDYEMSGPSGSPTPPEVDSPQYMNITCYGDPQRFSSPKIVTDATMEAETGLGGMVGSCQLRLNGTITSKTSGAELRFRYHHGSGQKSEVKTIGTNSNGVATFEHVYPLEEADGTTGKVRIVGVSHVFQSDWADYEVDCASGPLTVEIPLPPTLELNYSVVSEVLHQGYMCPEGILAAGRLHGRGPASGTAAITINGNTKPFEGYSITGEEIYTVLRSGELSWGGGGIQDEKAAPGVQPAPQKSLVIALDVYSSAGGYIGSETVNKTLYCRSIQSTFEPPETLIQAITVTDEVLHQGMVCPAAVRITGTVIAQSDSLGTVWVAADSQPLLETAYDFEAGKGEVYNVDHELSWDNKPATTQSIKYSLVAVAPDGETLAQSRITKDLSCRSKAFDIVSPKGRVPGRSADGEIRLTGGVPAEDYTLRFYRKVAGSYEALESAALPATMSGLTQSFPLAALTGTRFWRLQVCRVASPLDCKVSDFRKPLLTGQGGQEPQELVLNPNLVVFAPTVTGLPDPSVLEEAPRLGRFCPVKVNLGAQIAGQGSAFSGSAVVQVGAQTSQPVPFSVGAEGFAQVTSVNFPYVVTWDVADESAQTIQYAVRLLNENGDEVDSDWRSAVLECREPNWAGPPQGGNGQEGDAVPPQAVIVPGAVTFVPKVSEVSEPQVLQEVELNGMICPSEVGLKAQIVSQGSAFSGSAVMQVGTETLDPVPFSVAAQGLAVFTDVNAPYDVSWTGVAFTEGAAPQQTMPLTVRLLNENGDMVGSKSRPAVLRCRKAPVVMAAGKVNFRFQILAPRAVATNGNIRLSGAEPDQDYTLEWMHRQNNGQWKPVTSAHLPGEMTGASASFNVHAVESGTWKLRACKKGGTATAHSSHCKASTFQVVKKGSGSGPHAPPGGQTPEIMLITPGAINTN
ncbi:hypothetical protein [Pelagibius sp.]|uniref:hypothetical protein n=1 Tax=Pelagibius sp. TaxID=1931238 RepID=UPI003B508D66